MKTERIFLILTLLGITVLFILSCFQKPIAEGAVSKITTRESSTTILLQNNSIKFIIMNKTPINVYKNEVIRVYGTKQIGLNETIVFVNIIKK